MVLPTVTGASKGQHTESSRSPASTQAAYGANMSRDGMALPPAIARRQCEWPLRPKQVFDYQQDPRVARGRGCARHVPDQAVACGGERSLMGTPTSHLTRTNRGQGCS